MPESLISGNWFCLPILTLRRPTMLSRQLPMVGGRSARPARARLVGTASANDEPGATEADCTIDQEAMERHVNRRIDRRESSRRRQFPAVPLQYRSCPTEHRYANWLVDRSPAGELDDCKKGMTAMGYNRSGTRRKQRLQRHKREITRLLAKMDAATAATPNPAPTAKPAPAKK
jgi:hypothetical protein